MSCVSFSLIGILSRYCVKCSVTVSNCVFVHPHSVNERQGDRKVSVRSVCHRSMKKSEKPLESRVIVRAMLGKLINCLSANKVTLFKQIGLYHIVTNEHIFIFCL